MRLSSFAGGQPVLVTLDGVELPELAVGPMSIVRGRDSADARPAAAVATLTLATARLPAVPDVGQPVRIELGPDMIAALGVSAADGVRFVGTVSDVAARPARGITTVTAAGPLSAAARVPIGDVPWPAELDGARATRILSELVEALPALAVGLIDPGTVRVIGRDVDRQPAAALLDELAAYTGGDCWETRDGALEWHDAAHRINAPAELTLSAAAVLSDPEFTKDLEGLVTDLTVGYGLPVYDAGDGSTTQASVRVLDSLAPVTTLGAAVSTPIESEPDALAYAVDIVGRRSRARWRVPSLAVDVLRSLDADQRAQLVAIEPGALLALSGLPTTAPFVSSQLWIEGWTETYARYAWRFALSVSSRGLTGPAPRWADVPLTWQPPAVPGQPPPPREPLTWSSPPFDGLSWIAAAGWWSTEDADTGRWADVPANARWNTYGTPMQTWSETP